jgi:hypothetical protein
MVHEIGADRTIFPDKVPDNFGHRYSLMGLWGPLIANAPEGNLLRLVAMGRFVESMRRLRFHRLPIYPDCLPSLPKCPGLRRRTISKELLERPGTYPRIRSLLLQWRFQHRFVRTELQHMP